MTTTTKGLVMSLVLTFSITQLGLPLMRMPLKLPDYSGNGII